MSSSPTTLRGEPAFLPLLPRGFHEIGSLQAFKGAGVAISSRSGFLGKTAAKARYMSRRAGRAKPRPGYRLRLGRKHPAAAIASAPSPRARPPDGRIPRTARARVHPDQSLHRPQQPRRVNGNSSLIFLAFTFELCTCLWILVVELCSLGVEYVCLRSSNINKDKAESKYKHKFAKHKALMIHRITLIHRRDGPEVAATFGHHRRAVPILRGDHTRDRKPWKNSVRPAKELLDHRRKSALKGLHYATSGLSLSQRWLAKGARSILKRRLSACLTFLVAILNSIWLCSRKHRSRMPAGT